jgi:hypothetical protein
MDGACSAYEGEGRHTGFWWGTWKEKDHLKDPGLDQDDIKVDLQEVGCGVWKGLIWFRIETGGGRL